MYNLEKSKTYITYYRFNEKDPAVPWTEVPRESEYAPPDSTEDIDDPPAYQTPGNSRTVFNERERRQKLLNENQVQASAHFVRRMNLFMRYLIKHQPLIGGKLTDWIIRYETQGRGSVHAHMLWWIDINPQLIPEKDVIKLPNAVLKRFGLVVEKEEKEGGGGEKNAEETAVVDVDEGAVVEDENDDENEGEGGEETGAKKKMVKVYNEEYLNLTNANIWALKKKPNIRKKLHIGIPPLESLTYVQEVYI